MTSKSQVWPSRQQRETNLCARASEVRTEHDNPGSLIREFFSTSLEAILEQFEVSTTAVATLLVFNLVLNDERLVRNFDGLVEGGRYGVMRRDTLCDETTIALHDRVGRFFD
jgi:hypothetical protein